jgi:hypothetical protein
MPAPPELHATNRRSFSTMDATDVAFQCYCTLVALELALKDADASLYPHGHDLVTMVTTRFFSDANIGAAATAMAAAMRNLFCTSRSRRTRMPEVTQVSPTSYPDLRYVRRQTDFSSNATTETDLEVFKSKVDALLKSLATAGFSL